MKGVEQRTVSSVSAADRPSGSKLPQLRLTMPTNIAQSFADDLIKEFDSRRSQLQLEMLQFQVQKLFLKRESEKFSVAWDDTFNGKALCNSLTKLPLQLLKTQKHSHSSSSASDHYPSSIISPGFFTPPIYPVLGSTSREQTSSRSRERRYSSGDVRSSNATQPEIARAVSITNATRRKSAGELLRRSSAYIRQKLQILKSARSQAEPFQYNQPRLSKSQPEGIETADTTLTQNIKPKKSMETVRSLFSSWRSYRKPQHQHVREIFDLSDDPTAPPVPPLPPSKIATNTTISISQLNASVTPLSRGGKAATTTRLPPPVIRQYPPRPLVYSAVDLPLKSNSTRNQREESATLRALKSRYRQSMPVLPQAGLETAEKTHRRRRSSDSEIPAATNTLGPFEKNARRLSRIMGCNTLVKRASTSFRKKMNKVKKRRSINDVFRGPEQQVEILVA